MLAHRIEAVQSAGPGTWRRGLDRHLYTDIPDGVAQQLGISDARPHGVASGEGHVIADGH